MNRDKDNLQEFLVAVSEGLEILIERGGLLAEHKEHLRAASGEVFAPSSLERLIDSFSTLDAATVRDAGLSGAQMGAKAALARSVVDSLNQQFSTKKARRFLALAGTVVESIAGVIPGGDMVLELIGLVAALIGWKGDRA